MHVLWFDRNDENRTSNSQALIWDEHEFGESLEVPIDNELNIIVYNSMPLSSSSLGAFVVAMGQGRGYGSAEGCTST